MNEIIQENLNRENLRLIYLIFKDSIEVYKQLVEDEKDIFSGENFKGFKGRLLGYVIQQAFNPKFLPKNFPYQIDIVNMSFNQKRTELRRGNIVLTISKVVDRNKLPTISNYKKEYSKGNSIFSKQLQFDYRDEYKIKDIPIYGIITYIIKNDMLSELNIVIPSSDYSKIEEVIPIPLISIVNNNNDDNSKSKSILDKDNLKKQILNKYKSE